MKAEGKRILCVRDLGHQDYESTLDFQRKLAEQRKKGEIPDVLILVEHDRVYTMGRNAKDKNVVMSDVELSQSGIRLIKTDRGGDVTYHGPGQLVGYPIMNIGGEGRGVLWYVQKLEEVICSTLEKFGLKGVTDPHNRGVWIGNDKIAAIGVRVTRHVTMHGFALNVSVNLADYKGIIPCGIVGRGITSLNLLVPRISMSEVKQMVVGEFLRIFEYDDVRRE
ncbi:MAG: lipoyl(octanoyl) transferase LipB [Kiritimatiellae bacterium]|nr:lipoyl(octanoyl) transferase LipB [Kiritimatiellia bacterium]MDD5520618.1 lipoyl(octanoyl) transferase LipB [Kiritimatiellia bacterium]